MQNPYLREDQEATPDEVKSVGYLGLTLIGCMITFLLIVIFFVIMMAI
jgi:hypothetical protein